MKAFEIVKQIQEAFPKIADKLSALTGKHYETFSSHGREPKTQNPNSSGNVSPVDHIMKYARQYEASEKGAGLMLIQRIAAELEMEFLGVECADTAKELLNKVLTESTDVLRQLNDCDTSEWRKNDYLYAETQCDELSEIALKCKAKFRGMRKSTELKAVA